MGNQCCASKPSKLDNPVQESSPPTDTTEIIGDAVEEVALGQVDAATEEMLEEADFPLVRFGVSNPHAHVFKSSKSIRLLRKMFSGASFRLSMIVPVEIAGRVFLNAAVLFTSGTDFGDWVERLAQADLMRVQDGIAALRNAELKTAAFQLKAILSKIPVILKIKDQDERRKELERLESKIGTTVDHAQAS